MGGHVGSFTSLETDIAAALGRVAATATRPDEAARQVAGELARFVPFDRLSISAAELRGPTGAAYTVTAAQVLPAVGALAVEARATDGYLSTLELPLTSRTRRVGSLTLWSSAPRTYGEFEVAALKRLAPLVASAIAGAEEEAATTPV